MEKAKVDFCSERFGAVPVPSSEDFATLNLGRTFDLIWCGSLLTHFDETPFREALALFSRSLAPGGVALITLHGRYSPTFQRDVVGYLPHDRFAEIEASYIARGFGYADYGNQQGYGISLSSPSFVLGCLESDRSITTRGYVERGWDDHQDVLIVEKRSIDASWGQE
jgi:SAM-dependent methyltransferase